MEHVDNNILKKPHSVRHRPTQSDTESLSQTQTNSVRHRPTQSDTDPLSQTQTHSVRHRLTQSYTDELSQTQTPSARHRPTQSDTDSLSRTQTNSVRHRHCWTRASRHITLNKLFPADQCRSQECLLVRNSKAAPWFISTYNILCQAHELNS